MKRKISLALVCLASTAGSAIAQNATPQCGSGNFDQAQNAFTIVAPDMNTVNQQCLLTVYPRATGSQQTQLGSAMNPSEGNYIIELSGGGGGGGGGASRDYGGGGGGAGAAHSRTALYLPAGVYKLTIGSGGDGGAANGGPTEHGNPTSLTNAATGTLVAGFQGADMWTQRFTAASYGTGGHAKWGGSSGGSGGNSGSKISDGSERQNVGSEKVAEQGGVSRRAGIHGVPGAPGAESSRSADQANAGGGGGASAGNGGPGQSVDNNSVAGAGTLGGGGGGGSGGVNTAHAGGRGGHGFIRLTMN